MGYTRDGGMDLDLFTRGNVSKSGFKSTFMLFFLCCFFGGGWGWATLVGKLFRKVVRFFLEVRVAVASFCKEGVISGLVFPQTRSLFWGAVEKKTLGAF